MNMSLDNLVPGLSMLKNAQKKEQKPEGFADAGVAAGGSIGGIIGFAIAVLAAMIAWQCNSKESTLMRVFYTFIAYIFGLLYIFYYALMKRSSCPPSSIVPLNYIFKSSKVVPAGFSYGF